MGVFSKVKESKASGGGQYFEPDHEWVVLVNAIKNIETRKGDEAFIVECKVLTTTCDKVRPGVDRSWYVDMGLDAAPGNVKHFLLVCSEQVDGEPIAEDDIDEAGILELCGEAQPWAGTIIGLKTWNKPTQAGNPFTRHTWRVLSDADVKRGHDVAVKLGLVKEEKKVANAKK